MGPFELIRYTFYTLYLLFSNISSQCIEDNKETFALSYVIVLQILLFSRANFFSISVTNLMQGLLNVWCMFNHCRSTHGIGSKMKNKSHKTGVINDPLGQTHSLASSEHCFHLKF